MKTGLSSMVRDLAASTIVDVERRRGAVRFSIPVSELRKELLQRGFPPENTPQICTTLKTSKFLDAHGLELEGIDGPPSLQSTTVVFHYRFKGTDAPARGDAGNSSTPGKPLRKKRSVSDAMEHFEAMRGILKETYKKLGGAEAFHKKERESWNRDRL